MPKVWCVFGQTSDQYGTEQLLGVFTSEQFAEWSAERSHLRTRIQEVDVDEELV